MMPVHTPTLFLVLAAISILAATAVWLEDLRRPGLALRFWVGAYLAAAALAISSLMLFPSDPTLAVVVPTGFAFLALALLYQGLAVHLGRGFVPMAFAPIAVWFALALAFWHGAPLDATYVERRVVLCVSYIGYAAATIHLLANAPRVTRTKIATMVVFALYGSFYAARLAMLSPDLVPQEAALADLWMTLSIYKTILFVVATAYLFLGIWRERFELGLREAAEIDPLTGLLNRRTFRQRAERILGRDRQAALVLVDLDHFKLINDSCGHAVGDTVLREFADVLRSEARPADACGRVGGEEFAILMAGEDASTAARRVARIAARFRVEARHAGDLPFEATFSAGVATLTEFDGLDEGLARADAALYRAKRDGRDRIELVAERGPVPIGPAILTVPVR